MTSADVRRLALGAGVVGLISFMPTPLNASWSQVSFFGCTSSMSACASVEVATMWDGTKTNVMIRIRNWAGPTAVGLHGGAWVVQSISLKSPDLPSSGPGLFPFYEDPGRHITTEGSVATGLGFESWYNEFIQYTGPGHLNFETLGIAGCNTAAPVMSYSTCAAAEETSWVVLNFATIDKWDASSLTYVGVATDEYGCLIKSEDCTTLNVVPEPLTMTLLATGLAGIGAMWARRRKKDQLA